MKAVLTCDDVFDVLTREPFPSGGANDEVVESHLAVCHECRQLAEAFRPAVGLFHEALSAGSDDELPMYRGRLKPIIEVSTFAPREDEGSRSETSGVSFQLAKSNIRKLEASNTRKLEAYATPNSQPRSELRKFRALAIGASLVLVGSVVFAMLFAVPRADDSVPTGATVRAAQDRDYTLLATLAIPDGCRSTLEYADRTLAAEFVCCTKCHHAASRVASTNLAINKTSVACAACHDAVLSDALSMAVPRHQFCETLPLFGVHRCVNSRWLWF